MSGRPFDVVTAWPGAKGPRGHRGSGPLAPSGLAALAAFAALLAPAGRVSAAEKRPPLTGRFTCLTARARTSAPIPVEIELDWRGRGLLKGRLRIVFREGPQSRSTYVYPDVVLANASRGRFRLLLPSPGPGGYNSQLEARATLEAKDGIHQLGSFPVFVPQESERGLVVCVSEPRGSPTPLTHALVSELRLERFNPGRRAAGTAEAAGTGRALVTTPTYVMPEAMPSTPAEYCAFDVVVMAGEGFSLVREKQLEAALAWVLSGGSVLVLPGGGLEARHVRFLNALAGGDASSPFALTPRGTVEGEGAPKLLHAGLGRAVVSLSVPLVETDPGEAPETRKDFEGPVWRLATAFLWKVRRAQLEAITTNGEWLAGQERRQADPDREYLRYADDRSMFGRVPISSGGALLRALIPQRVKVLPLWIIITVLVLFVVVIGPVDYFVLGLLRRRKLTWITFPAAAVGFALFTMIITEVYMGSTDHRNSITVVDLGAKGRILRTNRYDVIVAASNRESTTDVAGGFFTPVDRDVLRGRYGSPYGGGGTGPPRYEGRVPARFTATQQVNQWEPQMNRVLTLGGKPSGDGAGGGGGGARVRLDWDGIDRASWAGPVRLEGLPDVREAIIAAGWRGDTEIVVFSGRQQRADRGTSGGLPKKVLTELCVRPQVSLFSVVSQISPTGGGDFEDVALLDPTDPEQWLLAVVVKDGQNFTVYRRLYHDGPAAAADGL